MPTHYYRYVASAAELTQILRERKIQSRNPLGTYYTTKRYDNPVDAQRELALPTLPIYRVGPIPADEMPSFNLQHQPAAPAYNQPGLGIEVRTPEPVWLFGVWNFVTQNWEF